MNTNNNIESPKQFSNDTKRHFLEIVSTYNKYQDQLDRKSDITEIAETLGGIIEAAQELAINETDDWFDRRTVKRNMGELKKLGGQFDTVVTESKKLDQRLTGLYEDMGHILSRYYKLGDINENEMKKRLGLKTETINAKKGDTVKITLKDGRTIKGKIESFNPLKVRTDPTSTQVISTKYIKSVVTESILKESVTATLVTIAQESPSFKIFVKKSYQEFPQLPKNKLTLKHLKDLFTKKFIKENVAIKEDSIVNNMLHDIVTGAGWASDDYIMNSKHSPLSNTQRIELILKLARAHKLVNAKKLTSPTHTITEIPPSALMTPKDVINKYTKQNESITETVNTRDVKGALSLYSMDDGKTDNKFYSLFKNGFSVSVFKKFLNNEVIRSKFNLENFIKLWSRELDLSAKKYIDGDIIEDIDFVNDATKQAEKYYNIYKKYRKNTNESITENFSPDDINKIKKIVSKEKKLIGLSPIFKKIGWNSDFIMMDNIPPHIILKKKKDDKQKFILINKKYVSNPDFVIGNIAGGLQESVEPKKLSEYDVSNATYINSHNDEYKLAKHFFKKVNGNERNFYDELEKLEDKIGYPKYMKWLSNALRGYKVDMYKDSKIKNREEAEEALYLLSK